MPTRRIGRDLSQRGLTMLGRTLLSTPMTLDRTALLLVALLAVGCSKPSASSGGGDEQSSKSEKKKAKKSSEDDDDTDKAAATKKKSTDDDEAARNKKSARGDSDEPSKSGSDDDAKKRSPAAANEADVKRYPDEKKIDPPTKVKTVAASYAVRVDSIATSKAVAALPKDYEVTELAERSSHFLIAFANPKKPDETLMGWIFRAALELRAGDGTKCAPGQVLVDTPATGAFCTTKCTSSKSCSNGWVCYEGNCVPGSE